MANFEHVRHKPPEALERPRELIIACAPMHSHINLSRVLRAAGCFAVQRVIGCGNAGFDRKIARDGADAVPFEVHRSLPPVLKKLRQEGYQIVGLEQTTGAECLYAFPFVRRTVIVLGNERQGLTADELREVERVAEIPVYGLPHSHNVATSAAMAMYEYCRQFPGG